MFVCPACPVGQYGEHCSGQCLCQNGGSCESVTGQCSCPPGWTGAACELGESCSTMCYFVRQLSETRATLKFPCLDLTCCPPVPVLTIQCLGKTLLYSWGFLSLSPRVWGRTPWSDVHPGLQLYEWREMWQSDRKMCVSARLDRRALSDRWLAKLHINTVLPVIFFSHVPLRYI